MRSTAATLDRSRSDGVTSLLIRHRLTRNAQAAGVLNVILNFNSPYVESKIVAKHLQFSCHKIWTPITSHYGLILSEIRG